MKIRPSTLADAPRIAAAHVASRRESDAGLVPEAMLSSFSVKECTEIWTRILGEPRTAASTVVLGSSTSGMAVKSWASARKLGRTALHWKWPMDGPIWPRSCERRPFAGSGDVGMRRRRLSELEQALRDAPSRSAKALAHFRLAVFHNNDGREVEAIAHCRAAIRRGLGGRQAVQAHAWLANRYCKVGRPQHALRCIAELRRRRLPTDVRAWVGRLEGRVRRNPGKHA